MSLHIRYFFLAALFIGVSVGHVHAQKAKDYTLVVSEITQKFGASASAKTPFRIAVVPFTSPVASGQNKFGEYLTESITGKLLESPHQYKVFERERMDAILKENELMLSGLMKISEAIKIGELLSIDALFSGTYTKLKSYIDVSGRLIDVASGEILVSYSGRIKLTKNLAALFAGPNGQTEQGSQTDIQPRTQTNNTTINVYNNTGSGQPSATEICLAKEKAMETKLEDVSTTDKINSIVTDAIQTPFDNTCGKFHYQVMSKFMHYKVQHHGYYNFLVKTLDDLVYPSNDERAQSIIEFITYDKTDDREWLVILDAICRSEYWYYRYLSAAFSKSETQTEAVYRARIDMYFDRANVGKMGKPQPAAYNKAFFQLMQGLGSKNHRLQVYTYERYADKITQEADNVMGNHIIVLKRMYEEETDGLIKSKIVRWAANYFNQYSYKKSPGQLYDFASNFDPEDPAEWNKKAIEAKNQEKAIKFPMQDLHTLLELCGPKFTAYATQTEYSSQRDLRVNFCLKYNVAVPGVIPTQDEAIQILSGNNLEEQLRIMKLLVQMGSKPKPLETILIGMLDRRTLDDKEKLQEVQNLALEILGHIKTASPKAIDNMVAKLTSYNYKESENSQAALIAIGKPAVLPVINKLKATNEQEGGLQYKLVVILGKLGSDATPAEPVLRKLLTQTKNADIRYAIEAALQSIRP